MPPKKKNISNNMTSQDGPDHGDSESRQNASSREEERASEGAFTLSDLVATIHAMEEIKREMADTIKELKIRFLSQAKKMKDFYKRNLLLPERGLNKRDHILSPNRMLLLCWKRS
ncbi:unnamed protein product [Prunus armeniaca]